MRTLRHPSVLPILQWPPVSALLYIDYADLRHVMIHPNERGTESELSHTAPTVTEDIFDTDEGQQVAEALGLEGELGSINDDDQRARLLESITRQLITNPGLMGSLSNAISALRAQDNLLSMNENGVLEIIDAASKIDSDQAQFVEKEDWELRDRGLLDSEEESERSERVQISANAVYALIVEAPVDLDEW